MRNPEIKPRSYQLDCLEAITQAIESGASRALIVMASGLGKTLTSAFAVERFFAQRNFDKVLMLCHSEAILSQSKDKYKSYFGEEYSYGMFVGEDRTKRLTDFFFASFQTMKEHREEFAPDAFDYVIVDEAHHSQACTYSATIAYFTPEFLLGMTATPDRLDGKDIAEIYGEPIYELSFVEAVSQGLLAECDYRLVLDDMSQEKIDQCINNNEKLAISQLNRTIFIPKRDKEIVRLIKQYSAEQKNPKTIIFCRTIEHSQRIAKLIGDDAMVVHGGQNSLTNNMALEAFRQGKIHTIVSVQILNEGVDIPDANIIVFLRNTASGTIFYQQLGRGTRPAPDKGRVIILDFVANCERIQSVLDLKQRISDRIENSRGDNDNYGRQEHFTLNIATPEFKSRMVDIVHLLAVARGYTKEILLADLVKLYRELGRPIGVSDLGNCKWIASQPTYLRYFGTMYNACAEAGIPILYYTDISDEEMLEKLREKQREVGDRVVKAKDIDDDPNMPCAKAYSERFETVTNARKLAGIKVGYKVGKAIDEETALKQLYDKVVSIRRRPTCAEINADPDLLSASYYTRHFDGLDGAMIKSGADDFLKSIEFKRVRDERNSAEKILANFKILVKEKGRKPTPQEIDADDRFPSYSTVKRNAGTTDELYKKVTS